MNKILRVKKIVFIGFFAAFLAVFLSTGTAQASFWDWLNLNKTNNDSQQQQAAAIANADTSSSSSSASANHTATTGSATNITSTSATLNGTVNPKGENVGYRFSYYKYIEGTETGTTLPLKYTSWKSAGSGSSDVSVSADISGLSSGATYYYYIQAYSYKTKKYASIEVKSFTTSGGSSSSSSSSSVQQYTLKVKIAGAGKIMSNPTNIDCKKDSSGSSSGTCSIKVNKDESITLDASPNPSYEFGVWGDACRGKGSSQTCVVKMGSNKTVSATFNKKAGSGEETVAVLVRKTGKGVGKVVSMNSQGKNISGINCGTDCSENYKKICEGTSEGRGCSLAYFRATAEKGSTFGGWGGDCLTFKNVKDQCYVTLDGNKTINASFNEGSGNTEGKYYDLTVTVSEGGTVAATDNKINCDSSNSPCKHSYGKNGTVTLKATPNSGYAFKPSISNWGSCDKMITGNNSCQIKMTKNRSVSVKFTKSSSSSSSSQTSSASANHTATTGSATNITSTSATLNGTVNPKGENVGYRFSYYKYIEGTETGTTLPLKYTSWKSAGSGSSDVSVSADISGLSSGATYYYYIQAYSYKTKKYASIEVKSFTTSGGSSNSSSSSSSSQTTASTYKLKVTISGNGRIQDSYSKIDCGSNMACEATYSKGQMIRIKTEDTDSTGASYNTKVESWDGGGCSGTSNSCEITMDSDKEVTVKFVSK